MLSCTCDTTSNPIRGTLIRLLRISRDVKNNRLRFHLALDVLELGHPGQRGAVRHCLSGLSDEASTQNAVTTLCYNHTTNLLSFERIHTIAVFVTAATGTSTDHLRPWPHQPSSRFRD